MLSDGESEAPERTSRKQRLGMEGAERELAQHAQTLMFPWEERKEEGRREEGRRKRREGEKGGCFSGNWVTSVLHRSLP